MKILKRSLFAAALMCGLLSTASADLNGNIVLSLLSASAVSGAQVTWPGGEGFIDVDGTWNGATFTLQYVGAGGTLHTAGASCIITSSSSYPNCVFRLPRVVIQATISGAGGSTSLTAKAYN